MRSLRFVAIAPSCVALNHALRCCLQSREDEVLNEFMRMVLRRNGALTLPRVTALLSDDLLEIMSKLKGGLRRYLQDRPSRYRVETLQSGVTVVMLTSNLRNAGTAAPLFAQVLANIVASPQQQLSVAQLFAALPVVEQRKCGNERYLESFLLQHPSLVTVQNGVVRATPTSCMLQRGVTHLTTSSMSRLGMAQDSMPQPPVSLSTSTQAELKTNKLIAFLRNVVPCSYYVPLRFVMDKPQSSMCFMRGMSVDEILEDIQRLPTTILDCRVIGKTLDDVFFRMMDAERRPYVGDESSFALQYEVLGLGAPLIEAFRAYAAQSLENKKRIQSGIAMKELKDILPHELIERLHLYQTEQKDAACIFVFDRLRHLFDVNMSAYMVRPWEVLPTHEQPSSLTWQTTPVPVVLRHALIALTDKPFSSEAFLTALPVYSRKQLQRAYSSLADFVAQHSLYLLLKDDLVWTPYLAAKMQGARVPGLTRSASSGRSFSDSVKARMLMEILPHNHPVDWHKFRLSFAARELPFETHKLRAEFFERHREYFRIYEALGTTTLVVGRRDGVPPPAHLLQPPCMSLGDLVRQIALFSIGGAQEVTILNNLSKEARLMVRRYGSVEQIAQQLPMWFCVYNERKEQGSAIISYIATDLNDKLPEEQPQVDEFLLDVEMGKKTH